ncbi:hypothetical protein ACFSCW_06445 [Sphingomonas tabacisoli]|uniref:Thiolase C-terminal domain-containing protein n=1 Tax=Sphingomonas tabacisoli TaxID=2249466 RepID=A0ABW4I0N8_9SPHN
MVNSLAAAARDKAAIVGIGATEYSKDSGRSVLSLAVEASRAAIRDSGLDISEIDGIVRCDMDNVQTAGLAAALGLPNFSFWADTGPGGSAPCMMVSIAVAAVLSGQAKAVLCFRSLNGRSEGRLGLGVPGASGARVGGRGTYDEFFLPYGMITAGQAFAMMAHEHMTGFGTKPEHLGEIALACREAANQTPHAQMHDRTLTMNDYLGSRMIASPLRLFDYCLETDGACAIIVTSTERARDLASPLVTVSGTAGGRPVDMRVGMMFPITTRNRMYDLGSRSAAEELYQRAGMGPSDIDVAQFYDCFTISVLVQIEAFGFCELGEGGPFVASGAIRRNGSLPINTAGGHLSEGYIHGMNHILEAVRQVRGTSDYQIEGAETALATCGLLPVGAGLIVRKGA